MMTNSPRSFCQQCPSYADQNLIDEFNDPSMGVALTMLHPWHWAHPGVEKKFYDNAPSFIAKQQEAMTIASREHAMAPYQAVGRYGLLFHITQKSRFWEYFQVATCGTNQSTSCLGCWCGKNDTIVGGPGDGLINNLYCRSPIKAAGKDYAWFKQQKIYIQSLYKKVVIQGNDPYNEFQANGYSKCDLAGAMISPNTPPMTPESDEIMCKFLTQGNPERKTPWPLYKYTWDGTANTNTLVIERKLSCPQTLMIV